MGYLNNSTLVVDAILTRAGREKLAKTGELGITQFALGDDEIDYSLWNPAHPLGSDYYGIIIENMPILEAIPDETQALKYKLVTLENKSTTTLPYVSFNTANQGGIESSLSNVNDDLGSITFTFSTPSVLGGEGDLGYQVILTDTRAGLLGSTRYLSGGDGAADTTTGTSIAGRATQTILLAGGTSNSSFTFTTNAINVSDSPLRATIIIQGLKTGARVEVPVKVNDTDGL